MQAAKIKVLVIDDARQHVMPLFIVQANGDDILFETRRFIGTAFFATNKGHAITAAHLLPVPRGLDSGHRLIGVAQVDGKPTICGVTKVTVFEDFDLGLVFTNLDATARLPLSSRDVYGGEDIQVVGARSKTQGQGTSRP